MGCRSSLQHSESPREIGRSHRYNRKLKHLPSALTAPLSVAPSIDSSAPSIDNDRLTPATLSVPSGQPDDVSALTHSFMSPAEQTIQRYKPPWPVTFLNDLGPLPSLMTHSPTFRAATLWVLAVVCSVAPTTMFSEAAGPWIFYHFLQASVCAQASPSQETPLSSQDTVSQTWYTCHSILSRSSPSSTPSTSTYSTMTSFTPATCHH